MYKTLIASLLLVSVLLVGASARIINVPDDQPTIQLGINSSINGDTVLVYPGTYVENISFNAYIITLASLYLTTGNESYVAATTIQGHTANPVVIFNNHGESTAKLIGFTITGGNGAYGGGVHCMNSNPEIAHNIITGNNGTYGGGVCCRNSGANIHDNLIANNTGLYGGGIYAYQNVATISNNTIEGNTASDWGGGILLQAADCNLYMNLIKDNTAVTGGGIHYNYSAGFTSNNFVTGNSAGFGGGVVYEAANPVFVNNIVYENSASNSGGGFYCKLSAQPFVANSIIWENTATLYGPQVYTPDAAPDISYCTVQDGWEGAGNMASDPRFRDIEGGDFHLMAISEGYPIDSPCIDAGHPGIWDLTLDGMWGLGTYLSDIGLYGGRDTAQVLPSPILVWPTDGERIEQFDPTLSWRVEPGADSYEVQVDDEEMFYVPDREYVSSMAEWTVSPDLVFGTWYWRVRSHNQLGWGPWSEIREFRMGPADISDSPDKLIPSEYSLSQSFPNPFNAHASITIGLPEASWVMLDIYDLLGRKVETLANSHLEAGYHTLTWNAHNQSSGLYLYRIETINFTETRSMLLLK